MKKYNKYPSYEEGLIGLKRYKVTIQCPIQILYITAENFIEARDIMSKLQLFEYWMNMPDEKGDYLKGLSVTIDKRPCRIPIKY